MSQLGTIDGREACLVLGLGFDDPVKSEQKGGERKEKPSTYFYTTVKYL